ncbi:MAG: hypothetical protein PVF54_01190 [Anaerolineae bacterium]
MPRALPDVPVRGRVVALAGHRLPDVGLRCTGPGEAGTVRGVPPPLPELVWQQMGQAALTFPPRVTGTIPSLGSGAVILLQVAAAR